MAAYARLLLGDGPVIPCFVDFILAVFSEMGTDFGAQSTVGAALLGRGERKLITGVIQNDGIRHFLKRI
ncbi:hypothetical protein NKH18_48055 [Streptomyces sp. M10(2022)]